MSGIYEGTHVEQAYLQGRDAGFLAGQIEFDLGLGRTSDFLRAIGESADDSSTREGRAYWLGTMRGYREATRTLMNGRWGT